MDLENPHAGQGAVLLDIGDDVGALVVEMPSSMVGEEVDILPVRPDGVPEHSHQHGHEHAHGTGHGHPAHVAVLERPVGAGRRPSLVFPELLEGTYVLMPKGTRDVHLTVEIRGGAVTEACWPG